MEGDDFEFDDDDIFPHNEDNLVYPWLHQQQQQIPHPDDFLSIPRGPIVHEGFVPEEGFENVDSLKSPYEGRLTDSEPESLGGADFDEPKPPPVDDSEEDPDYDETGAGLVQDEDEMIDDEGFDDDEDGPFARTRRRRGRPKGPRVYATSRGRYGRNMGRGGRGIRRGPRQPVEPSQEFLAMQNAATDAFIDERNYEKALDLIQQAISINPEVYSAHSLLSEIYFDQGDEEKAIAALLTGAHALPKEPSVWHQIADVCLQRVSEKNRQQALHSASYCYARLLQINQKDQDSRFQRAAISRLLGNRGKALKDLQKLLVELPNNPSVLRQMAEVYTDMKLPQRARELYERSIAYHQSVDDRESFTFSDINVYVELFAFSKEYARGIAVMKSLSRWILGRKADIFWDSIQDDDREWDAEDEPRRVEVKEFHPGVQPLEAYGNGLPLELRVKLGIFRLKLGTENFAEALRHFMWLEAETQNDGANVEDYVDLYREVAETLQSVALFKDALRFYQPLVEIKAYRDVEFCLAAANCFVQCENFDEAVGLFEQVKETDQANVDARLSLSRIYNRKGLVAKAKENAQEAIFIGRENLLRPERRKYERKEQREQRERAERELKAAHKLKLTRMKSGSRTIDPDLPLWRDGTSKQPIMAQSRYRPLSSREQRQKKIIADRETTEELKNAFIASKYSALLEFQDAARSGDSQAQDAWLDNADEMIRDFRSNKVLFPIERHMLFEGFHSEAKKRAFRKLHQKATLDVADSQASDDGDPEDSTKEAESSIDVPTSYRGLSFSTWLDVFLEYSLILARMGPEHKEQSYATIAAATDCVVWYHSKPSMLKIHTVWFTCALALKDGQTMNNLALRWFMKEYQFVTDIYGLFSALNILHQPPPADKSTQVRVAEFRMGPNQKFMYRQIRANDFYLPADYNTGDRTIDYSGPVPAFMREDTRGVDEMTATLTYKDPNTGKELLPEEMDIALLVLYGQILYAGNSFPNALNYFFRAYALNKDSPLVCLSIALCYLHQSAKRQSENRHMLIMQGMAFFQEYAECRTALSHGPEYSQALAEIEFNRSRIWQMLGLTNLAVEGYWQTLHQQGDSAIKSEAAFALQTIYALGGDTQRAREITEEWLVIE